MAVYLEHANITVKSIEETVKFLSVVCPHWYVRGQGSPSNPNADGTIPDRRWLHFGDERTYFALEEATEGDSNRIPYKNPGINHLGIVVQNIQDVIQRCDKHGFRRGIKERMTEYRTRYYFYDGSGVEWELIEYHTDDFSKRNSYTIPESK